MLVVVGSLNYLADWIVRISEYVQNNAESHVEEHFDHSQGSRDQVLCNVLITLSGMPSISPELFSNMGTLTINRAWCLSL